MFLICQEGGGKSFRRDPAKSKILTIVEETDFFGAERMSGGATASPEPALVHHDDMAMRENEVDVVGGAAKVYGRVKSGTGGYSTGPR
jgi:hypothetical protein